MKKLLLMVGIVIFTANYAGDGSVPAGLPGCQSCPIGLTNCGNTCWMNACLQCLFNMEGFNQEVIKVPYPTCSLGASYVTVYKTYTHTKEVLPTTLLDPFITQLNKRMGGTAGVQQDSQEGMTTLLDALLSSKDSEGATQKLLLQESQSIKDLDGTIKTSAPQEPAVYLSLRVSLGQEQYGLENLLHHYFADDPVEWGPELKIHNRKPSLMHLSDYLIITVGIFATDFTSDTLQKQKIYWKGTVPEILDMDAFIDAQQKTLPTQYQLIGVVVHMGGLNSGHYVAYINKNNQWFYCNDDTIHPLSSLTFSGEPYIIFYKRIGMPDKLSPVPVSTEQDFHNLSEDCNTEYELLLAMAESLQELSHKNEIEVK